VGSLDTDKAYPEIRWLATAWHAVVSPVVVFRCRRRDRRVARIAAVSRARATFPNSELISSGSSASGSGGPLISREESAGISGRISASRSPVKRKACAVAQSRATSLGAPDNVQLSPRVRLIASSSSPGCVSRVF